METDMKKREKFFLNGIILSLVGLVMKGAALTLGAYISRTVGAEGVGLHSLVMNVYGFAFTFATAGISLTVTALVAAAIGDCGIEREGEVMRGAFIYASVLGLIASLLLFVLSPAIATNVLSDRRLARPLAILSLSLIPSSLVSVISGYFIGKRRVFQNACLQILSQVARVVFTVSLLSHSGRDPVSSITALSMGVTLTEITVLILSLIELFLARVGTYGKKGGTSDVRGVSAVALPIALSAYVRSALITLEHAIIPMRLLRHGGNREEALSSYGYLHGMALPLLLYPLVPLSSFGSLLLPEFAEAKARGEGKRMRRIASLSLSRTLRYAIIVGVLLFLFSEELGYAVYGSYDVGRYIAILAPVVPLMFLDHVADNMLKGIGEQVYSMWVNILDSILSVALVFVLLPIMGIEGYAIVIIAMELFNFTLSIIRVSTRVGFSLDILRDGVIPLALAACSGVLTRLLFTPSGKDTPVFVLVLEIVFAISLYVALSAVLSRLPLYKGIEDDHRRKSEEKEIG